jgi:chromosome segregation ATPase
MDESQEKARVEFQRRDLTKQILACRLNLARLWSCDNDEDVGSNREVQGPENKKKEAKEVKPLSEQNAQAKASPHQAQGVVNVAPGEGPAKQVTYEEMQNQLKTLSDQLMKAEGAEIEALGKKVAELESEIGKRATKVGLTRKLTELSKKLSESEDDEEDTESAKKAKKGKKGEDGDAEDLPGRPKGPKGPDQAETAESAGKATGKGLVSTEEMDQEASGPSAPWFKDLLKANAAMGKSGRTSFSG